MGFRLEVLRPACQVTDPAVVPPIREPTLTVWGPAPRVKSVSPNLMASVPAPVLTSTLFKSMCGNGELLIPVLTLISHTPIEPMNVTQPANGQASPGLPSAMVTVGLTPSLRYNVATAAAGAGPVNTAAQLSTSAQPIATTALVSFISPPWPIGLLSEPISLQRSALSRAGVVPTGAVLKNPLDSDVAVLTHRN